MWHPLDAYDPQVPPLVVIPVQARPRVSVLMLGYRRASLPDAVAALVDTTHLASYEVLVLLNGARPEVTRAVGQRLSGAKIDYSPTNLGFAGGVNRLARSSSAEFLVLLNDDTQARAGWLDCLVQAADEEPDAAIVTSRLVFPDGRLQEAGARITPDGVPYSAGLGGDAADPRFGVRRDVDFGAGAGLLIRRAAFEALGGLDERYYPAYYEDLDLALRLRARGWRVVYEPGAVIEHERWGSSTEAERGDAAAYTRWLFRLRWSSLFNGPAVAPYSMPDQPLMAIPPEYGSAVGRPGEDPAQSYRTWLDEHRPAPREPS
jgi:GT2 family glycosyltransferase